MGWNNLSILKLQPLTFGIGWVITSHTLHVLCVSTRDPRMMDGITSSKAFHVKYICGVVFLYYTYLNFTRAVFPLEPDVAELVGDFQHKHWIVFTDKLARVCTSETKSKTLSSLIEVFSCMSKHYTNKCFIRNLRKCCLIRRYPNVLRYVYRGVFEETLQHIIQIIVHRHFSLNVTVIYAAVPYQMEFTYRSAGFTIAGKRFRGLQYPITLMYPNNTVEVAFDMLFENHVLIEYSVAQKLGLKDFRLRRSEAMPFLWCNYVVRMFHLRVDIRARLVFDVISCVLCKLIVYDGPNERLPIIMKINDTYTSEKVVASTFQVFVVIAEDLRQEKTMHYFPTYIETAVFNLTNNEYREITFDNDTNCFGHSMFARLCVYTFYASALRKINFSFTALQFMGSYQGKQFAAGIVLYNQGQGATTNFFQLRYNLDDFEMISPGKTMHVAIFVYSVFASLSFHFTMSTTDCNALIVSNDWISYSGHITPVDNTLRAFRINKMDSDECFQLLFISSLHKVTIILPHYTPALLEICKTNSLGYPFFRCSVHNDQTNYKPYKLERKFYRYTEFESIIHIITSFTVYPCKPPQHIKIRIKQFPCKLPCYYLRAGPACSLQIPQDNTVNDTCDVCANRYILCKSEQLTDNISFAIGIKSSMCPGVHLELTAGESYAYGIPFMTLSIKRDNAIVTIPDFISYIEAYITSEVCLTEIPIGALLSDVHHKSPENEITRHLMKDVVWNGVVYRPHRFQFFPVNWEAAAQYCLKADMALVTIQSLTEYHFLTKTLLEMHDILTLYVGLKRKVIYSCNCHRISLINRPFSCYDNERDNFHELTDI